MALPNKLAHPLIEPVEEFTENDQETAAFNLKEIQTSLANIQRMQIETEQVRAVSEPLIEKILHEVTQRIQVRQQEIAELKAEKEILQAKLLAV